MNLASRRGGRSLALPARRCGRARRAQPRSVRRSCSVARRIAPARNYTAVRFAAPRRAAQMGTTPRRRGCGRAASPFLTGCPAGADASLSANTCATASARGHRPAPTRSFCEDRRSAWPGYDVGRRRGLKTTRDWPLSARRQLVATRRSSASCGLTADRSRLDGAAGSSRRSCCMPTTPSKAPPASPATTRRVRALSLTARSARHKFRRQRRQLDISSTGASADWRRQPRPAISASVPATAARTALISGVDGDAAYVNELIDIGVDYGKSLSLARRTRSSFGTQTSVLQDQETGRHFRLNGQRGVGAPLSAHAG